ncbi:MAG: hypothetical protein P9L95_01685 [Candidatus Tenebribacter mawsonii]|nr:hypothetical protein [Candidatus Tenebribacter mawsonii]
MKKSLSWFAISLLITILGAISIFFLFGVRYYNENGVVFWSILIAWITILLVASVEIGRQEKLRQRVEAKNLNSK